LHVVGDDEFFEALFNFVDKAGFKIEEDFVLKDKDIQIADHLAFVVHERGVATLADTKVFDVICDLAMDAGLAILAAQAESPAIRQINDGGAFGEGLVLTGDAGSLMHPRN
jgi:hypothetical protein